MNTQRRFALLLLALLPFVAIAAPTPFDAKAFAAAQAAGKPILVDVYATW